MSPSYSDVVELPSRHWLIPREFAYGKDSKGSRPGNRELPPGAAVCARKSWGCPGGAPLTLGTAGVFSTAELPLHAPEYPWVGLRSREGCTRP